MLELLFRIYQLSTNQYASLVDFVTIVGSLVALIMKDTNHMKEK